MAMRFRTSVLLAFGLLVLYFIFWRDEAPFREGSHTIDVLKGYTGTQDHEQERPGAAAPGPTSSNLWPGKSSSSLAVGWSSTSSADAGASTDIGNGVNSVPAGDPGFVQSTTRPAIPEASDEGSVLVLQVKFDEEYDALGL